MARVSDSVRAVILLAATFDVYLTNTTDLIVIRNGYFNRYLLQMRHTGDKAAFSGGTNHRFGRLGGAKAENGW